MLQQQQQFLGGPQQQAASNSSSHLEVVVDRHIQEGHIAESLAGFNAGCPASPPFHKSQSHAWQRRMELDNTESRIHDAFDKLPEKFKQPDSPVPCSPLKRTFGDEHNGRPEHLLQDLSSSPDQLMRATKIATGIGSRKTPQTQTISSSIAAAPQQTHSRPSGLSLK
ncbi:hypothetical protein THAOC_00630, partial [Thalassiosira oceanica]